MLTPEQLALIPKNLAAQMRKLEEDLVADIARRFEKNLSATDTALHQMEVLARAGKDAEEIKNLVLENTKLVEEQYKHLVLEGAALSYHQDIAAYLVGGKVLPGLHDNMPMKRMINAVMRQNWEGLDNLSNTIGFVKNGRYTPLDEFYKSELGNAVFKIHSGAFDYNTVLRGLVKDMADSGVRMIDYDNTTAYHVDVAGRRAVLTTLNQITGKMSLMNAEDMEQDLMEITAHAGARPSHAGWQGEVVSLSGKRGYYTLDQIGYGEVTGFMGANCRHGWYPFFEGISERAYSREYLESIDNPPFTFNDTEYTHYEATQRMRQLERRMRSTKRELLGYDAAGLKDDFTNASIKLRRQREHYLEFCDAAGIKPQLERVAAHGYNKNISSKSAWAVNKAEYEKYKGYLEPFGYQKTMKKLQNIKDNGDMWLLEGFRKAVDRGSVHVLVGIDTYISTAREIEKELIGLVTKDGVEIKHYTTHFVDRTIGQVAESHPKKRLGVPVLNSKYALLNSEDYKANTVNGALRKTYRSDKSLVTVETESGTLIQVNPKRKV